MGSRRPWDGDGGVEVAAAPVKVDRRMKGFLNFGKGKGQKGAVGDGGAANGDEVAGDQPVYPDIAPDTAEDPYAEYAADPGGNAAVNHATNNFRTKLKLFPNKFRKPAPGEAAPAPEDSEEPAQEEEQSNYLEEMYGEKPEPQAEPEAEVASEGAEDAQPAKDPAAYDPYAEYQGTGAGAAPASTAPVGFPHMELEQPPPLVPPPLREDAVPRADDIAMAAFGNEGRAPSYGPPGGAIFYGGMAPSAPSAPSAPGYGAVAPPPGPGYASVQRAPSAPNEDISMRLSTAQVLCDEGIAISKRGDLQGAYNKYVEAIELSLGAIKTIKSDYPPGAMQNELVKASKFTDILMQQCETMVKKGEAKPRSSQTPKETAPSAADLQLPSVPQYTSLPRPPGNDPLGAPPPGVGGAPPGNNPLGAPPPGVGSAPPARDPLGAHPPGVGSAPPSSDPLGAPPPGVGSAPPARDPLGAPPPGVGSAPPASDPLGAPPPGAGNGIASLPHPPGMGPVSPGALTAGAPPADDSPPRAYGGTGPPGPCSGGAAELAGPAPDADGGMAATREEVLSYEVKPMSESADESGSVRWSPGMRCSICKTDRVTFILPCGHTYCDRHINDVFDLFEQCNECGRAVVRPEARTIAY